MNKTSIQLDTIYNQDCLQFMKTVPDEFMDLIITSPPYNLANSTGNWMSNAKGSRWEKANIREGYEEHTDNMPHEEYVAWQRSCLHEMIRILKPNGAIFYNHKWRVQGGLLQDRNDILHDFPVRQIIIWKRSGGINFNDSYFVPTYEVIYMICKPKFKLLPTANRLGDIWEVPEERSNSHPAPFPVSIPERCIMSTDAQLIYDPFMGSGSTAIASINQKRFFIGTDTSKKYCELATKRIQEHMSQKKLF